MVVQVQSCKSLIAASVAVALALLLSGVAVAQSSGSQPLSELGPELLDDSIRSQLSRIVILPGTSPASSAVTGSYGLKTPGLLDGADDGQRIGDILDTDIGGIPIGIPIPVLRLPGAIVGGISGAAKRRVQDFRDALTEDLASAANQSLTNDALATDVFWRVRDVPTVKPKVLALTTPVPNDTDAIMYVSLGDMTIDIQGDEAVITTYALATLRRLSDGKDVFVSRVRYQDADSLSNWTDNNNAAWRDYANFARHYLGRELAARSYARSSIPTELQPAETKTVSRVKKNDWQATTKTVQPTLAWTSSATTDADVQVEYELEVYDHNQLVYAARGISEMQFTVDVALQDCKTHYWTVRPVYSNNGSISYGRWMRADDGAQTKHGSTGSSAAQLPAYLKDFASLDVKCVRR